MITETLYKPQFHTIERDWVGECCCIVAGGSSLIGFDFENIRHNKVIAVKSAAEHLPWADVYFSLDIVDHKMPKRLEALKDFQGAKIIAAPENYQSKYPKIEECKALIRDNGPNKVGLSKLPDRIQGHNSGFGALNYAYLRGASQIFLLGFDFNNGGYWYDPKSTNWKTPRVVNKQLQTRDEYIKECLFWFEAAAKQIKNDPMVYASESSPLSDIFNPCYH